jgi:hypothetical protein
MSRWQVGATRLAVGIALASVSMGAAGAASAGATPHAGRLAAKPVPEQAVITVTQVDSGHSYTLDVGDQLVVTLSGPASMRWTTPTTSNGAVLVRRSGSGGTTARATFRATSVGKSVVSAVHAMRCTVQCGMVTSPRIVPRQFHVAISVT